MRTLTGLPFLTLEPDDYHQTPIQGPTYFALSSPRHKLYTHLTSGPFAARDDFMSYVENFDQPDPSKLLYAIIDKPYLPSLESPSGALVGIIFSQSASPSSFSIGTI